MSEDLISEYKFELVEDHHHPGSGIYGVVISLSNDIGDVFPYLNSILKETNYDHQNRILIGAAENARYAFRRYEIRVGGISEPSEAIKAVRKVVDLVNRTWRERTNITPSVRERKTPPVYEIYMHLPKTNCRKCGCVTCLAFAAAVRSGEVTLDHCSMLSVPEQIGSRNKIIELFSDTD